MINIFKAVDDYEKHAFSKTEYKLATRLKEKIKMALLKNIKW